MPTYFAYAFIHPLTKEHIDSYESLKEKYKSEGKIVEYWNSLLRITLRKFGLPFDYKCNKALQLLFKGNPDAELFAIYSKCSVFSVGISKGFRISLAFRELSSSTEFKTLQAKRERANSLLSELMSELKALEVERRRLISEHNIEIPLAIKIVKNYPVIGEEIGEGGLLIADFRDAYIKFNLFDAQLSSHNPDIQ